MDALDLLEDIYRTRYNSLTYDQRVHCERLLGVEIKQREIAKFPFEGFNIDKFVADDKNAGHLKEIDGKWFFYGESFLRVVKEDDEFEVLF